ncbi:MAG: hypothetical protein WCD73_14680, partial [Pseudolabrys sp.]
MSDLISALSLAAFISGHVPKRGYKNGFHRKSRDLSRYSSVRVRVLNAGAECFRARNGKGAARNYQAFWVLRCERNSYTMRLSPDMAARIQRLK